MMNENDDDANIIMPDHIIILENSPIRQTWDILCFLFTAWNVFSIMYRLFLCHMKFNDIWTNEPHWWIEIDWVTDFFFLVNILLHSKVFALKEVNEQGKTLHITDREIMLQVRVGNCVVIV